MALVNLFTPAVDITNFDNVRQMHEIGYVSIDGGVQPIGSFTLSENMLEGDEVTVVGDIKEITGLIFFRFNSVSYPLGGITATGPFEFSFTSTGETGVGEIRSTSNTVAVVDFAVDAERAE